MGQMETAREQRLAAAKARRATPEFAAAGERLLADRAADAELRRQQRQQLADDNMRSAIDAARMSAAHDRFIVEFEMMLRDVAADQRCDVHELDDGRSIEVLDAYASTLRPSRRNAAHVLGLYVGEFGLSATEAWERLRRIGGGAR